MSLYRREMSLIQTTTLIICNMHIIFIYIHIDISDYMCVHVVHLFSYGCMSHVHVSGPSHVGIWVWGQKWMLDFSFPHFFRVILPLIYIFSKYGSMFQGPSSFCPLQGEDTRCNIKIPFKKLLRTRTNMSSCLCGRHSTELPPQLQWHVLIYYVLKIYLG